jgi:O-antigen ligase
MVKFNLILFVCLLSICIQKIDIINFGSGALKPYHVIISLCALFFLQSRTIKFELIFPLLFIFLLIFISLFNAMNYGLQFLIFNYVFLLIIVLSTARRKSGYELTEFLYNIKLTSLFCTVYVIFNSVINYASIESAQIANVVDGTRPEIPRMLFGGGLNLEATWIAMLTVFFIDSKYFLFMLSGSLFVSSAYISRIGIILNVIIFIFWIIKRFRKRMSLPSFYTLLPLVVALLVVIIVVVSLQFNIPVVNRFLAYGNEPGSLGRLEILRYVYAGIAKSDFLGFGPGNTMEQLTLLGMSSHNNNVHNYYIQVILDFGILGLIGYLALMSHYLMSRKIILEFKLFVILYLVASFVQFRGAEPLFWFVFVYGYVTTKLSHLSTHSDMSLNDNYYASR